MFLNCLMSTLWDVKKCTTVKELFEVLKIMPNHKSTGNVGLAKESFETFWSEVKYTFWSGIFQNIFFFEDYIKT